VEREGARFRTDGSKGTTRSLIRLHTHRHTHTQTHIAHAQRDRDTNKVCAVNRKSEHEDERASMRPSSKMRDCTNASSTFLVTLRFKL
jgi:hypothetical protein